MSRSRKVHQAVFGRSLDVARACASVRRLGSEVRLAEFPSSADMCKCHKFPVR